MKAKLISTNGEYLDAIIDIDGNLYCVMDEFGLYGGRGPKVGETFDIEFSNLIDEDESWESIFSSNPEKKIGIEQIEGWKYRAYGEITSINPVEVNCGILSEEDVIQTHDPKVIGEYIAFTISRLGGSST
ncbi:hypothetical protein [Photobacterium nomapromontoriensis]|uniref:hypothetical protein n=1 Tax=Photobacterium nomapromontoriensis TaxID=2910237 RepID=UPI003D0D2CEF